MHPIPFSAFATAFVVAVFPACLDARPAAIDSDTLAADSIATDATDASDTLAPDTTTIDPCASLDCDDRDECTIDVCTAGTCTHTPLVGTAGAQKIPAEPPECIEDANCDDLDSCTIDSCVLTPGTCGGVAWGACTHVPDPAGCPWSSCTPDLIATCQDGDPCTLDGCEATVGCTSTPIGNGLCDSHCSIADALPLNTIWTWIATDSLLTTVGTVAMGQTDCDHCEGCACTGPAALVDGYSLNLLGDSGPTCTYYPSGTPVCAPLLYDVRYLIWGDALIDGDQVGASAELYAVDLAGYCLDTAPTAIAAVYDATFSIEQEATLTFTATLHLTSDDSLVMTIDRAAMSPTASVRLDLAAFSLQSPQVTRDAEGRLNLTLELPWINAPAERENVYLFARESALVGSLGPLFHVATTPDDQGALPPREDTLPFGDLRLERRTVSTP